MAEEAGGELRVEQACRQRAAGPGQHLEVLLGGVQHGRARGRRAPRRSGPTSTASGSISAVRPSQQQLHERELRVVACAHGGTRCRGRRPAPPSGRRDDLERSASPAWSTHRRRSPGRPSPPPGRCSIQASVPPATFTALPRRWPRGSRRRPGCDRPMRQMTSTSPAVGSSLEPLGHVVQRDEAGAGDVALDVLLGLADVDEHRAAGSRDAVGQLVDGDLADRHGLQAIRAGHRAGSRSGGLWRR